MLFGDASYHGCAHACACAKNEIIQRTRGGVRGNCQYDTVVVVTTTVLAAGSGDDDGWFEIDDDDDG